MSTNEQLLKETSETIDRLMALMEECIAKRVKLPQEVLLILESDEKTDFTINGDGNFLRKVIVGLVNYTFQNLPSVAIRIINDLEYLLSENEFNSMTSPPNKTSIN